MVAPDKATAKYLAQHAAGETAAASLIQRTYEHCLVIPACRESAAGVKRVWQHLGSDCLIILIINTGSAEDSQTRELWRDLSGESPDNAPWVLRQDPGQPDRLLINRWHDDLLIPVRQGVGLARKTGADIALALISEGRIRKPLIHTTDADVILPADYFDQISKLDKDTAAWIYRFRHTADESLRLESLLYDVSMHYYVRGLRLAGSGYAFFSIGSTLVVSAAHYARVHGFPRRSAGEDFYLLNKLAKTGQIEPLSGEPVSIQARLSDRVPFGTGPALRSIAALPSPLQDYRFYHPETFRALAALIRLMPEFLDPGRSVTAADPFWLAPWLEQSGFLQAMQTSSQIRLTASHWQQFCHEWFDGFRTLKFIHFMRDNYYPSQPLSSICETEFLPVAAPENPTDLERLLEQIAAENTEPAR